MTNLKIGLPVLVSVIANSVAKMTQLRPVNTFGVVAATAYSIGFIVTDLADASLRGFARASAIMVGQSIGAGLKDRARKIALKTSMFILSATTVGAIMVYLLRNQLKL